MLEPNCHQAEWKPGESHSSLWQNLADSLEVMRSLLGDERVLCAAPRPVYPWSFISRGTHTPAIPVGDSYVVVFASRPVEMFAAASPLLASTPDYLSIQEVALSIYRPLPVKQQCKVSLVLLQSRDGQTITHVFLLRAEHRGSLYSH
ncbi:nuclear factor of activated T-cells 5, tonicity-responsive [Platysternon megacephalum]|uniref:Nuclear factor of activated T-cells 5, tonicity-responsive n=1 Tax=Platysternon megacephalum TaxID=55544 RepID=A0A4D9E178_9SAUR|nr:nuclear factor of activated T-cells 5, tonicity-responsive [Platysternon megacephalum]